MSPEDEWVSLEDLRWGLHVIVEGRAGDRYEDLENFFKEAGTEIHPPHVLRPCPIPPDQGCFCKIAAVRMVGDGVEVKLRSGEVLSLEELVQRPTSRVKR